MLLDLPPELINLIVGHLAHPSSIPRTHGHDNGVEACWCIPEEDDRELVLYDGESAERERAYETDALHFGMAHPYIADCIANGGWIGVVDVLYRRGLEGSHVIPCVSEEYRGMVK
jgi:hypothetical protein